MQLTPLITGSYISHFSLIRILWILMAKAVSCSSSDIIWQQLKLPLFAWIIVIVIVIVPSSLICFSLLTYCLAERWKWRHRMRHLDHFSGPGDALSPVCVCTFKLNDLRYLAYWFILILSGSCSKVRSKFTITHS